MATTKLVLDCCGPVQLPAKLNGLLQYFSPDGVCIGASITLDWNGHGWSQVNKDGPFDASVGCGGGGWSYSKGACKGGFHDSNFTCPPPSWAGAVPPGTFD